MSFKAKVLIFGCGLFLILVPIVQDKEPKQIFQESDDSYDYETFLFVGDIMFDRGVEYWTQKQNNIYYPFYKIANFLGGADYVFGNLEGPIVKEPKNFSSQSLKFAFATSTLKTLQFGNFNFLSLANNHTLNMGQPGLAETRELLKEAGIEPIGETIGCLTDYAIEEKSFSILAINKTFDFNCSNKELAEAVAEIKAQAPDKPLIVSIHWGVEYHKIANLGQQELAHQLIEAGVDLIIGHHPHVVQNIEEYRGKIIFYSLGNFVFDQNFSKEVKQGLALGLELFKNRTGPENKFNFYLFPVQIELGQPYLMLGKQRNQFLAGLAEISTSSLRAEIKNGIITR